MTESHCSAHAPTWCRQTERAENTGGRFHKHQTLSVWSSPSTMVQTQTWAPLEALRCQFEGVMAAGSSEIVFHHLESSLLATAGREADWQFQTVKIKEKEKGRDRVHLSTAAVRSRRRLGDDRQMDFVLTLTLFNLGWSPAGSSFWVRKKCSIYRLETSLLSLDSSCVASRHLLKACECVAIQPCLCYPLWTWHWWAPTDVLWPYGASNSSLPLSICPVGCGHVLWIYESPEAVSWHYHGALDIFMYLWLY